MICVNDLVVSVGAFSLRNISFDIAAGQYAILMGKTGCGKTTLLETICGLRAVNRGSISLHGRDVTELRPGQRGIGYVPQDGALFPNMTVSEHLGFSLRLRRVSRALTETRVTELARLLRIEHLLNRKPTGLSGGEAQRVALGRALGAKPSVMFLDEPLNALDAATHDQMCDLLRKVCREANITTIHVTHNREEAERLADRIFIMDNGAMAEEQRA